MAKLLLILLLCLGVWATDFGAMSTQELLAIMNYTIKKKDQNKILSELKSRISEMSPKEKKIYIQNLKLLKQQNAKK